MILVTPISTNKTLNTASVDPPDKKLFWYFKQYSTYSITTSCRFHSKQEVLHISTLLCQNYMKLRLLLPPPKNWQFPPGGTAYYMHIHEQLSGYQTVTPTRSQPFWFKVPISPPFSSISIWSIIKTQLTTNSFEGFFKCCSFSFFYVHCRKFFWLQCTLFNTGRSRPPNKRNNFLIPIWTKLHMFDKSPALNT